MTTTATETTQVEDKDERSKKMRAAYGAATASLREKYRDEFDQMYADECQSRGVEYTPRPSAEQKALQQLNALLEEFPHLRGQVALDGEESDTDGFVEDEDDEPSNVTHI